MKLWRFHGKYANVLWEKALISEFKVYCILLNLLNIVYSKVLTGVYRLNKTRSTTGERQREGEERERARRKREMGNDR